MIAQVDTPRTVVLSDAEQETLRCMVGHIVPSSAEFGVPGADDPAIFADILGSVGRYEDELRQALRIVQAAAGGKLSAVPRDRQTALLARFRAEQPVLAGVVGAVTARCYYRDDRVMEAIGMEVRAPYPLGFKVEQGDWALLEPVRRRGKKYRDAGQ